MYYINLINSYIKSIFHYISNPGLKDVSSLTCRSFITSGSCLGPFSLQCAQKWPVKHQSSSSSSFIYWYQLYMSFTINCIYYWILAMNCFFFHLMQYICIRLTKNHIKSGDDYISIIYSTSLHPVTARLLKTDQDFTSANIINIELDL